MYIVSLGGEIGCWITVSILNGNDVMAVEGVVTANKCCWCIRDDRVSLVDMVHVMWYYNIMVHQTNTTSWH